jgi:hypothetical protein
MKRTIAGLIFIATLGVSSSAAALPTVKDWQVTDPGARRITEAWLSGAEAGLQMGNVAAKRDGRRPLYCQPAKLALRGEQVASILDRYIAAHPDVAATDPLVGTLLFALRETFPCDGASPGF